jgi:indoleamine 2,3-dioxygenase
LIEANNDSSLSESYNLAVEAMKRFRDTHVKMVALYIVGPSRSDKAEVAARTDGVLKGTGGSNLMSFLKGTRNDTVHTKLSMEKYGIV